MHNIIIEGHPVNPQNILAISPLLVSLCLCNCQISVTQNLKSILPLLYQLCEVEEAFIPLAERLSRQWVVSEHEGSFNLERGQEAVLK